MPFAESFSAHCLKSFGVEVGAAFSWLPPDSAPDLLRSAGIDPMRRAQTLSLEEWGAVDRAVRALRSAPRDSHDSISPDDVDA